MGIKYGLKPLVSERKTFEGTFVRKSTRPKYRGIGLESTVLLERIYLKDGHSVCNHSWLTYTKSFEKLGTLNYGDRIRFDARVSEYSKDYAGRKITDYRLSNPTKISIVGHEE